MENQSNQSKTILIIEDDQSLLKAINAKLTEEGFEILQATDGDEGLNLALNKHPDLILLDVIMPKMDGMTMLDKLREDSWGKTAHVIIFSNLDAKDELLEKVTQDEPSYYLRKADNTLEEIVEKIKEVLRTKN